MSALFGDLLRRGLTLLVLGAGTPLLAAALAGAVADLVLRRLGSAESGLPRLARLAAGTFALVAVAPTLAEGFLRFMTMVLQALAPTATGR